MAPASYRTVPDGVRPDAPERNALEAKGISRGWVAGMGGRNVSTAPAPARADPIANSKPPTHPRLAGLHQGRTAATAMVAAIARGTSQSADIVMGNRIRNRMLPPIQAAGHAGKSRRRAAMRSCLKATNDAIDSPSTNGGATRLDQNRGCPKPNPPGANHHHATARSPCRTSTISQNIRQIRCVALSSVSSRTIPRPFKFGPAST